MDTNDAGWGNKSNEECQHLGNTRGADHTVDYAALIVVFIRYLRSAFWQPGFPRFATVGKAQASYRRQWSLVQTSNGFMVLVSDKAPRS